MTNDTHLASGACDVTYVCAADSYDPERAALAALQHIIDPNAFCRSFDVVYYPSAHERKPTHTEPVNLGLYGRGNVVDGQWSGGAEMYRLAELIAHCQLSAHNRGMSSTELMDVAKIVLAHLVMAPDPIEPFWFDPQAPNYQRPNPDTNPDE